VLFTVRLEIAVRVPRLHIVVRGTPDLGYRQLSCCISHFIQIFNLQCVDLNSRANVGKVIRGGEGPNRL
jgi:hypothetical protein